MFGIETIKAINSFNPRAREERDYLVNPCKIAFVCFNPRAREERDLVFIGLQGRIKSFNPRAREERDLSGNKELSCTVILFQSTRP